MDSRRTLFIDAVVDGFVLKNYQIKLFSFSLHT